MSNVSNMKCEDWSSIKKFFFNFGKSLVLKDSSKLRYCPTTSTFDGSPQIFFILMWTSFSPTEHWQLPSGVWRADDENCTTLLSLRGRRSIQSWSRLIASPRRSHLRHPPPATREVPATLGSARMRSGVQLTCCLLHFHFVRGVIVARRCYPLYRSLING